MTWLLAGTVLPAAAVCWVACFAARRWGPGLGLVDHPGHRKLHARPMPNGGGLAIWLGVVLPLVAGQMILGLLRAWPDLLPVPAIAQPHLSGLWQQSPRMWTMLAAGSVLCALGLIDDRRGLDWRLRLAVQTAVAMTMVALGWRLSLFLEWLPEPWATGIPAAVSVVWIVLLVNSLNMLDNMDGLSAGVGAIAAAMLAAVVLAAPDPVNDGPQLFVGGFLLVLTGSLLGFLPHNWAPARLYMGDAGAYLVGFLLAMTTLSATFAGGALPRHAILAPLCVMAVPLYDTLSVVWIRLRRGQSPFVGDTNHFSHRLVALGMSVRQAVATIYLATATCGLAALLLHQVDTGGAVAVLLMVVAALALVAVLETAARRRMQGDGRAGEEAEPPDGKGPKSRHGN